MVSDSVSDRDALVDFRRVYFRIPGSTREEVLEEISARLASDGAIGEPGELATRLIDRERLGCTGLGGGVAIPHCKLHGLSSVVTAVASTSTPVDFGAADGLPIDLVFVVASPADAPAAHLQTLARISRLLHTPGLVAALRAAESRDDMLATLRSAETAPAVAS
jgi:nitrogen PTS system EIIA component